MNLAKGGQRGPWAPVHTQTTSYVLMNKVFYVKLKTHFHPPTESSIYCALFTGWASLAGLLSADAAEWWGVAKWGRKKVAAPSSKNVLLIDLSFIAHTTSHPLTS